MLRITDDSTREEILEALTHLRFRAGRVTVADEAYAGLHEDINDLIEALGKVKH